jgi:hypothetical protein
MRTPPLSAAPVASDEFAGQTHNNDNKDNKQKTPFLYNITDGCTVCLEGRSNADELGECELDLAIAIWQQGKELSSTGHHAQRATIRRECTYRCRSTGMCCGRNRGKRRAG